MTDENKSAKAFQEWRNSSEGVQDRLAYYGESAEMQLAIVSTLLKLRQEVRDFALERCAFVSIGKGISGITLPGRIGCHSVEKRTRNVWIIFLDDNESANEIETTIAHEIGHAWRGDDRLGTPPDNCEEATALLTRTWGFQGRGANPEFQKERYRALGLRGV